jgi:cyclic pyranopterin phosphate synthase
VGEFTHFDPDGASRMVDVSGKEVTCRRAVARGRVIMNAETLKMIVDRSIAKGDVREVARLAGIMGAKKTSELIPLCHPLSITSVTVEFRVDGDRELVVEASCSVDAKTGVEMEALTAVSVACLTIYDMCKSVDRGMRIAEIYLAEKSGGQSGDFVRQG